MCYVFHFKVELELIGLLMMFFSFCFWLFYPFTPNGIAFVIQPGEEQCFLFILPVLSGKCLNFCGFVMKFGVLKFHFGTTSFRSFRR